MRKIACQIAALLLFFCVSVPPAPAAMTEGADKPVPLPVDVSGGKLHGRPCAFSSTNSEERRCRDARTRLRLNLKDLRTDRRARFKTLKEDRKARMGSLREEQKTRLEELREMRKQRLEELRKTFTDAAEDDRSLIRESRQEIKQSFRSERRNIRRDVLSKRDARDTLLERLRQDPFGRSLERQQARDSREFLRVSP